jgi:hypothetical protein
MRTFLTVATAVGLLALAVPTQASAQITTSPGRAAKATPAPIASTYKRSHLSRAAHKVLRARHHARHYHTYGYRARHYSEWRFSPSNVGYQGR